MPAGEGLPGTSAWLVLAALAGAGAGVWLKYTLVRRAALQGQAYARALSHLLSGDREQATGELAKVVEEDVSDVEPYFALGCLFRERGEHERAVRVHQGVLLRRDAELATRRRARRPDR